jgi:opacity protein-like surface antigen
VKRLVLALVLLLFLAPVARAEDVVRLNDLVEQAKARDGQVVTAEGEAIGDVMIRGEYGWVNISDGTNDIGIWAPAEALRQIRYVGRYHTKGDVVRVTGRFHRADPEHGGDLDIHAQSLTVVQPGGPVSHPVKPGRVPLALLSLAAAGGLGLALKRTRAV